jgi:DNA-binding NarL/FixJ family response regulator
MWAKARSRQVTFNKGGAAMVTRVLIVDDHSIVREGLRMLLARDPDLEVVGEAADGAEAIRQARHLRPDVVVMDLLMPVLDGFAATRTIRDELPETEVLALTSVLENASVIEAIRVGAIGYLLKDAPVSELYTAIKSVAVGKGHLSSHVSPYLLNIVRRPDAPEHLTPRETDVLRLLAQGHSNKEIARTLYLAEETVKFHVRHILSKLGVQSRAQAILATIKSGMVFQQP